MQAAAKITCRHAIVHGRRKGEFCCNTAQYCIAKSNGDAVFICDKHRTHFFYKGWPVFLLTPTVQAKRDRIHKPMTAMQLFAQDEKPAIIQRYGELSETSLGNLVEGRWQRLNPNTKELYEKKAGTEQTRYRQELLQFGLAPPLEGLLDDDEDESSEVLKEGSSGEDSGDSEDSDGPEPTDEEFLAMMMQSELCEKFKGTPLEGIALEIFDVRREYYRDILHGFIVHRGPISTYVMGKSLPEDDGIIMPLNEGDIVKAKLLQLHLPYGTK
jgi:hypothetical protein